MTQAVVLMADNAVYSLSFSSVSSNPPSAASSNFFSSSSMSASPVSATSVRAALAELSDPSTCLSPSANSAHSPSASMFLPHAKSTRSSQQIHKRTSSTASTASTASSASNTSLSSSASTSSCYPPSPLSCTPPSMVDVLPPSPSRLRIDSGMKGLLHRFDAFHAASLSPSSPASTAHKPLLSPSSAPRSGRKVNRTLSQQTVPPHSPTVQAANNKRKRTLLPHAAAGPAVSSPLYAGQLPSQLMLHALTSLPPLAARSLSIPAHFRATSASSTLPQFPFRSIAHDALSTSPTVFSPRLSAVPSRSPSPSTSPLQAIRRTSFSFRLLSPAAQLSHYSSSPGASFFPPSISASPILLPQPNFDAPPPSPIPAAPSPNPSSSPDPTPSPPASPSRWQGRGKLPLSGKTADGVAMVSCATVAELLRGLQESKRRKQTATCEVSTALPCETDASSLSSCSTPSPTPGSLPPFSTLFDDVIVFDCRFAYEYDGGHIPSAINITSFAQLQDILSKASSGSGSSGGQDGAASAHPSAAPSSRTCLVFHCEFSQSRAPQYFSSLRRANESSLASYAADLSSASAEPLCPTKLLSSCPYPDMYVMEGGYRRWVDEYAQLCEPAGGYVEMRDRRWREECGRGLKERKLEKKGEMERKRRRQQHGLSAAADDDCMRRITRSSTAAALTQLGALNVGAGAACGGAVEFSLASPAFRRTSSCSSLLNVYSPIPLALHEADVGESAEKEERRAKRERR